MKTRILLLMLISTNTFAEMSASPLFVDARIKSIPFVKNQVYLLPIHYRYKTTIKVASYETIIAKSIEFGQDIYELNFPNLNSLTLRAKVEGITDTNFSFETSAGRTYRFSIPKPHFKKGIPDDLTFAMLFTYPKDSIEAEIKKQALKKNIQDDLKEKLARIKPLKDCDKLMSDSGKYNLDYLIEGENSLRPDFIFDDGKFTYMKIGKNTDIGDITALDENNNQSMVNISSGCGYTIIHSVGYKFAITKNGVSTCITNLSYRKRGLS